MLGEAYTLEYTELFGEELANAVRYIATELRNPEAASRLIERTEEAIRNRSFAPEAFEPIPSSKDREHPYYRIPIGNYYVRLRRQQSNEYPSIRLRTKRLAFVRLAYNRWSRGGTQASPRQFPTYGFRLWLRLNAAFAAPPATPSAERPVLYQNQPSSCVVNNPDR